MACRTHAHFIRCEKKRWGEERCLETNNLTHAYFIVAMTYPYRTHAHFVRSENTMGRRTPSLLIVTVLHLSKYYKHGDLFKYDFIFNSR